MDLKGSCQHCGQNITFPANMTGDWAACPHCGQQTQLANPNLTSCPDCHQMVSINAPLCPHCGVQLKAPTSTPPPAPIQVRALPPAGVPKKTGPLAMGCAVIAGGFGLLLLFAAIGQMFESPQGAARRAAASQKQDAHFAAEQFIRQKLPGAQKVASFRESIVEQEGNIFRVAAQVDGLNAFGGPVRNIVGVEMELVGDKFVLKHLK